MKTLSQEDDGGWWANRRSIGLALLVRALFMLHTTLAGWRVTVSRANVAYWGMIGGNVFIVLEGVLVVWMNKGREWKRWCLCFLTYLLTVLPSIWVLQITTNEHVTDEFSHSADNHAASALIATPTFDPNGTIFSTTQMSSTKPGLLSSKGLKSLLTASESTWIILIQESLIYIIVLGRWMLPRTNECGEKLSEMLLSYMGMASDSMELYAIFDEEVVQKDLQLTYLILIIWSLSFIQFIPVFKDDDDGGAEVLIDKDVAETAMSIMFQDLPFLSLRLHIMVDYKLVTYSLVFFVVKNIVTLIILFYRLALICRRKLLGSDEEKAESSGDSSSGTMTKSTRTLKSIGGYSNEVQIVDEVRTGNFCKNVTMININSNQSLKQSHKGKI